MHVITQKILKALNERFDKHPQKVGIALAHASVRSWASLFCERDEVIYRQNAVYNDQGSSTGWWPENEEFLAIKIDWFTKGGNLEIAVNANLKPRIERELRAFHSSLPKSKEQVTSLYHSNYRDGDSDKRVENLPTDAKPGAIVGDHVCVFNYVDSPEVWASCGKTTSSTWMKL